CGSTRPRGRAHRSAPCRPSRPAAAAPERPRAPGAGPRRAALVLEAVTGRGEILTCSRYEHPELFDAVRAGLGQVAVVTRATLALVPAPVPAHPPLLRPAHP